MAIKSDELALMRSLAVAMVTQPRGSLQELAQAVGISKATLYRFSRTRDQLFAKLMTQCLQLQQRVVAGVRDVPADKALPVMIQAYVDEKEFTSFVSAYWVALEDPTHPEMPEWEECLEALDQFFLRGQREGHFRLDTPAPALSDMFISTIAGLIDAERRGRVARAGLADLIERLVVEGCKEVTAAGRELISKGATK